MSGEHDFLAERFEAHRTHLSAVAHRMLGSLAEADDAVQEAWFRLSRSDTREVDNLGGWLTTVVGRICLDMLRSRKSRAEESLEQSLDTGAPVPAATPAGVPDPEYDALLADSVGIALLVVLDTLTPAERLAFVLHDMFAVPYEEVATIVGRTPTAARQLVSRARRRVQGAPAPGADLARQRAVVDAFLAASRGGDFDGLLRVLDPDVTARGETGVTIGAAAVASGATRFAHLARVARHALLDGAPGLVVFSDDGQRLVQVLRFTFVRERIAVIEIVSDVERLSRIDVTVA
ncbi:sigma-70 family RNA polymerase sigma factor [Streptomyces sp. NPDC059861]|uniref:sigma-70 family RNA polymerase sigma factor n=1 Tax=Streptomyces sp. NPDC059861 TaxID=3346974 RepID=UPI003650ED3A